MKSSKLATLREIRQNIATGMSKEELEFNQHRAVAPGISVKDYIEMRLDFGEIEWRDDKLFVTSKGK